MEETRGQKISKILRTSFKYRPSIIINNLLPAELTKITEEEMLSFCLFSSRCTTYLVHIEICVIIQLAVRKGASATFWSPGFGALLCSAKSKTRFAHSTLLCSWKISHISLAQFCYQAVLASHVASWCSAPLRIPPGRTIGHQKPLRQQMLTTSVLLGHCL